MNKLDRLLEGSSFAGYGVAALACKSLVPPQYSWACDVASVVFGALAAGMRGSSRRSTDTTPKPPKFGRA